MVPHGENIFQKVQKHRKCMGKARGIGVKLGVPIGTLRVPINTQLNHGPYPVLYFWALHEFVLTSFFTQKN